MALKAVQFNPRFCDLAKGTPPNQWDSSHDLSMIDTETGERKRIGTFQHAYLADVAGRLLEAFYNAALMKDGGTPLAPTPKTTPKVSRQAAARATITEREQRRQTLAAGRRKKGGG